MRKIGNLIDGRWIESDGHCLDVENPSTGEILAQVPVSTKEETLRAVRSAVKAYEEWRHVPVGRRVRSMYKLARLMEENEDEFCRIITQENGKSIDDSRAEMKRALENVEVACGMPSIQQGITATGVSSGIDGEILVVPRGVFGLIAPFNFPAMVPMWFLPYAVASGNTYIVKPSEQAPLSMEFIGELLIRSELPPGVVNLVQGDRSTAEHLIAADSVEGISFVGSSGAAKAVASACAERGKRCQSLGGAKNHLVVAPDANLEQAVRNMITSCFGCAGQRCMAASVIVCIGVETYASVLDRFTDAARKVVVGDPLAEGYGEDDYVMGPVISAASLERIHGLIETGLKEGARLVLDGREVKPRGGAGGHFLGPTVFADVAPGSTLHNTEIFGPVVSVLEADSLEDAIGIVNSSPFGNGASLYTQDGGRARRFKLEADAGMIGINVGIPAPVAQLPFGGMKESNFSSIKVQSGSVVRFFTQEKVITERYW